MEQTMKRIRKTSRVKWIPMVVVVLIYLFIYIGIGTSTVSEVRDILDTGYLDNVELNQSGVYTVNGQEVATYPKYKYAVAYGEPNTFNYAFDGLTYTDSLGIGRKTFVFEYSWYGGEELNTQKVVEYIDSHYWLMVFRMVVFSNQLVIAIILFIGIVVINYWLLPIITHALASMFGLGMALRGSLAGDNRGTHVRIYEARILRKTVESYENSQAMLWLAGLNGLAISLYSERFYEDNTVFVALWVNVIVVIIYILHKIVVNHIKLVKQHKEKGDGEEDE